MNRRRRLLSACAAAALCLTGCAQPVNTDEDRAQIQRLLETYLRSVKTADVTLAETVWLRSPDLVVVTPLGRFEGWDKVREGLYINFLQKAFLERDLRTSDVHIGINGNAAWAVFDWSFTAKLANGQPFTSKGWESHVYQKGDGGWRIAHLHYSGQPPPQPQ
jgi:ketosteroid isomerase-like protein